MKAHLLDSVLNVRTRQCKVLKRTDDGAVEGSVGRRRALDGGHLSLRIDSVEAGLQLSIPVRSRSSEAYFCWCRKKPVARRTTSMPRK